MTEATIPESMVLVPRSSLKRVRVSMALLQQFSENSVQSGHLGLPGWLAHTGRDLASLTDMLAAAQPAGDRGERE